MVTTNYFLPIKSNLQPQRHKGDGWMRLVAAGRFLYGFILLAVGLTIFNLIGKNLSAEFLKLIAKWHIDAHLFYVHWLLQKISTVNDGFLVLLTVGNFIYAALAFIEGAGLLCDKRWAFWLVILDTASFIPIEFHQLYKGFSWINFALLLFYIATVIYLLRQTVRKPQLNPGLTLSPALNLH
jgi:uncharacterized membrane protein (DUF2068 family)